MVCIACLGVATLSFAGQPSPTASVAVSAAGTQVSVYNLPDGNGKALTEAKPIAGGAVDATITVTLNDAAGNPIFLYPFEDMWLETSLGGMVPCNGGTVSDGSTDINGQTTFTAAMYAGGYSDKAGLESCKVVVNGTALVGSDLDILFNSADINGDLIVNLSDTILFVAVYTGAYDYSADFSYDGIINLSDLVLYAGGLNTACP
jgi:hypothetical protein